MIVKAFSGKSIGDYVTGNDRPPSTNGFLKKVISFAADFGLPVAATMLAPVIGIPAGLGMLGSIVASLGIKAVTGNTLGDIITGDTDQKRRQVQGEQMEADYVQGSQLSMARQAQMERQRVRGQDTVVAQNIGESRQAGYQMGRG